MMPTINSNKAIAPDTLAAFQKNFRGQVIGPGDDGYHEARKVYNGMIDKYPLLIARCRDAQDVVTAVHFARRNELLLAVRGGGHNGAGLGVCDGGLVIDLSLMKGIRIDPQSRTVRVEPGCTQGEVDQATHAHGLAVPAGVVSSTGIAGLTLGGGHGYLTRKYGLTVDNLLEADVVLADGRQVTASESDNADLFWAIRGGGGNFGVITSFLFRAHPVHTVFAGPMLWHMDQAADVLRWYRDFMPQAPEELYGFLTFMNVPPAPNFPEHLHLKTVCGIIWCYCGAPEQGEQAIQPAREVAEPLFEAVGPLPFPALQGMFDPLIPPGLQWYWKGDFFSEIPDAAIDVHLKYGGKLPGPLSQMHLYPIDGAAQRKGKNETAFSYREANWSMVIAGIDPDPANRDGITVWAKQYWEALHPYSAGGAYVNFMMEEGNYRVEKTYRENYRRLAAIKRKYDPENLFRVNQNIRPAESES